MSKKFMKKTLAGIFALVIVASSTPITPFVTVMDSNSITVNAASPADDFVFNSGTITGYTGTDDDVEIPSTIDGVPVTSIDEYAFFQSSVKSVIIPDSVTSIGNRAFQACFNLTSITLPKSLESIGNNAFLGCGMKTVNYTGSETDWKRIDIDTSNNESLLAANITYDYVLPAPESDFTFDASTGTITSYKGVGGDVKIPSTIGGVGVTSIGESAFDSCASLVSVTIPEGVTSIGDDAFLECSNLTSVTIPESVTSIGDFAFAYCSNLASVTIPEGVTSIGGYAFYVCKNLASVTIPESVTSIGTSAFVSCSKLTSITAPCTLENSMKNAMGNSTATITYTHPCTKSAEYIYKVKCACGDTDLDYTDVFVLLANEDDFLKNVNSNDYTEDSWKAFEDSVMALAEIVSDFAENVFVSAQSELTDAISAYTTAKTALVLKDADYTAVNDAIDNVPDNLSIYTAESVNALNNALNDVVYDLDITRQDEVDAMAQAIADAIDGLKELADTSRLEAAIADAYAANEADYSASVWSDIQDKVAEGNTYVGAGLAADDVQGDVDAVTDDLNALLLQKLNDADYTAVDAAIDNIPDDLSIYTDASVDALIAAYDNVVRDLKEDKQSDVDAMATAIEDAIDGLVLKDADYTYVDKYIAQAANIDRSLYTDDSLADLDAAIAAVVHDLDITRQDEVTGYANDIYAAIDALEEKPKYDTLYEEYLVKAPTVTENGTYNKRAYHYENDDKVIDTEKVFAEDKAVTFEQWYLRTLIQYQTDGTKFDLRFVSMLDENLDQYQKAGFIFTINGTAVSDELSTVTANTSYIVDSEEVNISAFSQPDDYFFLQNYVFNIGEIDLDATLAVTAYVVLADGTEMKGTKAVTFTLRQFEC